MTIPKIIHYCWFGDNELPELVKHCIESWEKFCPDYKIILWNEKNYDIEKIKYIRDAYKAEKWAFVSDYARLDVLYNYGGIYLDTDVELIRPLDDLLQYELFMAIEKDCNISTGLGFGSVAGNETIEMLMSIYKQQNFINKDKTLNLKACTKYTTEWFEKRGYVKEDRKQVIGDAVIFPSDYFCPMDYKTGKMSITKKTYGIHWYNESWMPVHDRKIHQRELMIQDKLPSIIAVPICKIYRNSYRLVQYTCEGKLLSQIRKKSQHREGG